MQYIPKLVLECTITVKVPKKYSEFREVLQVAFSIFLWPPRAILVSNT